MEPLPWYSNYWLTSCAALRENVDCVLVLITGSTSQPGFSAHTSPASLFSCRQPDDPLPPNLVVLEISGSDLNEHFAATTGFKLHDRPEEFDFRKHADFKPLYGTLLASKLANYSHWGWSDIDRASRASMRGTHRG